MDSGSDDGTPGAARAAGAKVLEIPGAEFRHGPTRNLGAEALPEVDTVVFLVQDAVPVGRDFLATLEEALRADPELGAVTARQAPPEDADVFTRSTVERSPAHGGQPVKLGPFTPGTLDSWSAREWRGRLALDSIALAVRGPLFRRVRFRETDFGEDALLAYDLLWGGWALGHEPRAVVRHGHAYDPQTVQPRYRQDAAFFRERFGLRVRPGLASLLKGFVAELRADRRWLQGEGLATPGRLQASRRLRWAQVLAQYQGSQGPVGTLPARRLVPGPAELAA